MELYKKYRPQKFSDVVGQFEAVASLKKMLIKSRVPHVLMFVGASGCGKTTVARIVAKRLGASEMDISEMNSASYRGIDTIRDLMHSSKLAPMGKCRVWILDEVHKLSNDAQHAALKMLEDTGSTDYYILCTTDPERLIKPLVNRCTIMHFDSLPDEKLILVLVSVCKKEGIKLADEHIEAIADVADGSPRAALTILDSVRNLPSKRRLESIRTYTSDNAQVIDLCRALLQGKPWRTVANILREVGDDAESVRWVVLGYMRNVLVSKANPKAYQTIVAFSEPFFSTKNAGLTAACYAVVYGDVV
jgi:DNA polymerase-3 subunit gamma/tau